MQFCAWRLRIDQEVVLCTEHFSHWGLWSSRHPQNTIKCNDQAEQIYAKWNSFQHHRFQMGFSEHWNLLNFEWFNELLRQYENILKSSILKTSFKGSLTISSYSVYEYSLNRPSINLRSGLKNTDCKPFRFTCKPA